MRGGSRAGRVLVRKGAAQAEGYPSPQTLRVWRSLAFTVMPPYPTHRQLPVPYQAIRSRAPFWEQLAALPLSLLWW